MALREAFIPLVGEFYICQEKVRKSQGISETSGCGNHINIVHKGDIVVEFC